MFLKVQSWKKSNDFISLQICFHLHEVEFTKKYLIINHKFICLYLMEIIVAITYSLLQFSLKTVKSLSKTLYLQEIENVVWKSNKIIKTSPCTKRQMLLHGYYVYKEEYWLWISKAHWNLWSSVMQILSLKFILNFVLVI